MENHVLFSPYKDIHSNLALEQLLAQALGPDRRLLLLWVSAPAVVFGRFQNPWAECPVGYLETQGVALARRASGGGTVYHDPGNLSYSVITPRRAFDSGGNLAAVAQAVGRAGLEAQAGPRRDLWVQGRKVSGSAFQLHRDYGIHHGTLLISADLDRLRQALGSPLRITGSRAVASVPSPVANVGPLTGLNSPEAWVRPLADAFGNRWGSRLTPWPHPLPPLKEALERFTGWDWVYGQTPCFGIRPGPRSPVTLLVEQGRITALADSRGENPAPTAQPVPLTTAGLDRLMQIHPTLKPFITELHRALEAPGTKEAAHAL